MKQQLEDEKEKVAEALKPVVEGTATSGSLMIGITVQTVVWLLINR